MDENATTSAQRTRRLPDALIDMYPGLKDPEQDAASAITVRYLRTGEWRTTGCKLPKSTLMLLKISCDKQVGISRARAAAGAIGGSRSKRKQTASKEEANEKQTESKREANEKQTGSNGEANSKQGNEFAYQRKENEKEEKAGEKEEKDKDKEFIHTRQSCAHVREVQPRAITLGFPQFAEAETELRLLVPVDIPLAAIYAAADRKGLPAESLVAWATHRHRQGWRTGQGQGVQITQANVASDISIWASNQSNFKRAAGGPVAPPSAVPQQEGGGEKKAPRKWKFDKAVMEEDRGRYVWGLPEEALPQFAAWFCGEEGNERAIGFYERFIAGNGANAFRRALDKFTGGVASGEEPENRGAAFTAMLKA